MTSLYTHMRASYPNNSYCACKLIKYLLPEKLKINPRTSGQAFNINWGAYNKLGEMRFLKGPKISDLQ